MMFPSENACVFLAHRDCVRNVLPQFSVHCGGHSVQTPGQESLLGGPVCEAPAHGDGVGSEAPQRGSDERDGLHVMLAMEGSVDPILAVDAVLELPRPVRAQRRGLALAHKRM
eukprot:3737879-Rhodomonas_salina.1